MSEFEITELPERVRRERLGKWRRVFDAAKSNIGKAVFIAANGRTPQSIQNSGSTSMYLMARGTNFVVRTRTVPKGAYFWLEEKHGQ